MVDGKVFVGVGRVNLCSIKPSAGVSHVDLGIMSALLHYYYPPFCGAKIELSWKNPDLCCEVAMLAQELLLHPPIANIWRILASVGSTTRSPLNGIFLMIWALTVADHHPPLSR